MTTTKKVLLIAAPILIGGAIVFMLNKKPKKGGVGERPEPDVKKKSSSGTGSVSSLFPLKKGSRNNYVTELQNGLLSAYGTSILPKYGADGDWGTETDTAVKAKLGITQISSETELNNIIAGMKSSAASAQVTNTEMTKAARLVADWTANPNLKLMVSIDTAAPEVVIDYSGKSVATDKYISVKKNVPLSRKEFIPYKVAANGMLIVKHKVVVWGLTAIDTYILFRPSNTTLI